MLSMILQAGIGLGLLFFGGDWLVRGASSLAARMGVSPLAIGLTVVAFGTSAPELVVSLQAAWRGSSDISVGNVVGSNIANIALILGLAACIKPIIAHAKIVRFDAPLMLFVSLWVVWVLADGQATRWEGVLLVVGLVVYLVVTFWRARRENRGVKDELASAAPEAPAGVGKSLLWVLVGLASLVVGGHLLVTTAVTLATRLGLSQAAIGLTIVALGTSLPELATSVAAAIKGQGDIAIGNVVGSNLFNILGILGITAAIQPLQLGAITQIDLGVMVGLAALLALWIVVRPRLGRGLGGLLVAVYVGYTAWLLMG